MKLTPQSPQNLAPGLFSLPQAVQRIGMAAPQSLQNLLPSTTPAPQLRHFMPHFLRRDSVARKNTTAAGLIRRSPGGIRS